MKVFLKAILAAFAATVGLLILLALLLLGYSHLYEEPTLAKFAKWAEDLPRQTEMPVYMSDNRIYLSDGTEFYPEQNLKESYNIREEISYIYPACIVADDLYIVHTLRGVNSSVSWCISSINLDTMAAKLLYAWEDKPAVCTVDVSEDFSQRTAWYQDGIIYLNNRVSVAAYDIATDSAEIEPVYDFDFPERSAWVERCDTDTGTLYLHMDGEEHAVTLDELASDNPAIGEVIERMLKKADLGRHFDDPFYRSSLHTEDGNVWLLVRSVVYGSNKWMLFLRYDAELQQWLYAGCAYSWDGKPYDYYIVPVVESLT